MDRDEWLRVLAASDAVAVRIRARGLREKASALLATLSLLLAAGCGERTALFDGLGKKPTNASPDAEADRPDARRGFDSNGWLKLLAGGLGGDGTVDGVGAAARFRHPVGVANDGAGNLFVADTDSNTIRRVVIATGEVTTLAGSPGPQNSNDGIGPAAHFGFAGRLASDRKGQLFVADTNDHTIRKVVVATGEVTTLAGAPNQAGDNDGIGAGAHFAYPLGLASDEAGHLFVADNRMIRKVVVATGEVTTIAGAAGQGPHADGIGTAARFTQPFDVAYDRTGSLFVTDGATIRRVNLATGEVTTLAGTPGQYASKDGMGNAARFKEQAALTSDQMGNLFVADLYNSTIRKVVVATGEVTTVAGSAGQTGDRDGVGADARFIYPAGVASDRAGQLFVTDSSASTIRRVIVATTQVTTLAGSATQAGSRDGSGATARFASPAGMAWDQAGNLYVVDAGNHTIRKVTATGEVTTLAGSPGQAGSDDGIGTAARFHYPSDVVGDGAGDLYVADTTNRTIRKVVIATGQVTTLAGAPGPWDHSDGIGRAARFGAPMGLASDGAGNLFVTEYGQGTIRKVVMATAEVTTLAGSGEIGAADGIGAAASFYYPTGIASDRAGHLYVADSYNYAIRRVVIATREVTTVAGTLGQPGYRDGVGPEARFHLPVGIVVDGAGDVLVADRANMTVRRINVSTATVTTVIGSPNRMGVQLGPLPAGLREPWGLALGPTGELAISDATENGILLASARR
jgi:sugar lactone lactonase YvrE